MPLADYVQVARRFQRSIRIDTDLSDPAALEGFVCPESSAVVLQTMARHIAADGQGAFTWTGPYGTGKSNLVVALGTVLSGNSKVRNSTTAVLGTETAMAIWNALPPRTRGWRILPVVGQRARPAQILGEGIERARLVRTRPEEIWTDANVLRTLTRIAKRDPRNTGGLIIFIDEMGKFLEGAAYDGTDIYFFQELAELASRSNRRLIVIGVLHQAFEEYAHRLSREMRDEWAKIQGRFIDLAVNATSDEQIELMGRAIETKFSPGRDHNHLVDEVATLTRRYVKPDAVAACWPLHPITACLLGPISRRRFGQNQRSIFGFLNSTEPQGFQDFLQNSPVDDLYIPELLWDYLQFNLESAIMASPDGHRWATATYALHRCATGGGSTLHLQLLKTIALIDLFKERSGLIASLELLNLAVQSCAKEEIREAVAELERQSLIIYRKFSDGYSIFEGSDFDIDRAVDDAYGTISDLDFARLTRLAGLQPVIAKRHYHETGALRWFDTAVVPLGELEEVVRSYKPQNGSVGLFLLVLPILGDSQETIDQAVSSCISIPIGWDVIVGVPQRRAWAITTIARDLMALEYVRDDTPELQGDRVARLEVLSRIADLQGQIESEVRSVLDDATWYRNGASPQHLDQAALNSLASDRADSRFHRSPHIHNELLNRIKPSSNAVAARNMLLRRMALQQGKPRLGIEGYPSEGGLFSSLLEATGLHRELKGRFGFARPTLATEDPGNLAPAWKAAESLLRSNAHRTTSLSEVYDIWRKPPFGIRDGILPVLAVAFVLTHGHEIALYRQGLFQPVLTDLEVEYLSNDPSDIQLRWMELSDMSRQLLSDMADIVRDMDSKNTLSHLEPIDVARGLVSIYDQLPEWVGRTQRLSANAKRVRQLFKQANDPNRFIFDDIPQLLRANEDEWQGARLVADVVREGLEELSSAYSEMLHRLLGTLLTELGVPNTSEPMLAELRARAANIRQVSGDHRLEAFILRISQFHGSDADMESLASMATNKPPHQWVDSDIDRARIALAEMARDFIRYEAFAHVKGRQDHRLAMAVVVGLNGEPFHDEFEVADSEQTQVENLIRRVRATLNESGEEKQTIILAALAGVAAEYLQRAAPESSSVQGRKRLDAKR